MSVEVNWCCWSCLELLRSVCDTCTFMRYLIAFWPIKMDQVCYYLVLEMQWQNELRAIQ